MGKNNCGNSSALGASLCIMKAVTRTWYHDIHHWTSETLQNHKFFYWMEASVSRSHPELRCNWRGWAAAAALGEFHLAEPSRYFSAVVELHAGAAASPCQLCGPASPAPCLSLSTCPCSSCESRRIAFSSSLSFRASFSTRAVTLLRKNVVRNRCCKHSAWHNVLPEIPFVWESHTELQVVYSGHALTDFNTNEGDELHLCHTSYSLLYSRPHCTEGKGQIFQVFFFFSPSFLSSKQFPYKSLLIALWSSVWKPWVIPQPEQYLLQILPSEMAIFIWWFQKKKKK